MLSHTNSSSPPGAAEKVFTVIVLVFMTGAFMNLIIEPGPSQTQESGMLGMQIAWGIIYLVILALLVQHCPGFIQIFFRHTWVVLLLALVFSSAFWSAAPGTTVRRGISVLCTTLFGIYLAMRYDSRNQLRLLGSVCRIAVIGSFIFGILGLGSSVDALGGVWIGIFSQKNGLGRMMVFSALVFFLEGKTSDGDRVWSRIGIVASFVLILLSKSSTSLVAFFVLAAFCVLRGTLRGSLRRVAAIAVAGLAAVTYACYWILHNLNYVTDMLHKDVTLTGRLYIWILGTVMALRQPWLGYGYSAFWLGPKGPSARIWVALKWAAPGAHNGLLELWLDLGLVGIVIFLIGFVVYSGRALRAFRNTSAPDREWPLIFFAFLVLMNLTESALLGGNSIFWTLYVAAAVCVSPRAIAASAPRMNFGLVPGIGPTPNVANGQI